VIDESFAVADAAVNSEVLLPGMSWESVVHVELASSDHHLVDMTDSGIDSSWRIVGLVAEALIDDCETLYYIAAGSLDEELRCPSSATMYFPLALWFALETDYVVAR